MAALNSLGGAAGDTAPVRGALDAAAPYLPAADVRAKLHFSAARAWADGEIGQAAAFWEQAVAADPRDLLALRLAHDTHFYLGAAEKLRDVPLLALPAYEAVPEERGFVLGMAAFGLEETGDYGRAEILGRQAVAANPADAWAVHAVAHVLEMQDRPAEGLAWLRELEPHWAPAAGLAVHNWWHAGLYLIELGRADEALALYDANIRGNNSTVILDLVDAAALLWRLELLGVDVGPRWAALVPLWEAYAEDHVLAFNDVHIALTFAGADEMAKLDRLEESVAAYAAGHGGTNAKVSAQLGLPLIRAMRAFRAGDYAVTAEILAPVYKNLAPVGGSNAQRDLFIQTLGIAAVKAGERDLAQEVAAERSLLKAGRPRAWAAYNA
jgi:tetratricopeptide (TPR) repeat protein